MSFNCSALIHPVVDMPTARKIGAKTAFRSLAAASTAVTASSASSKHQSNQLVQKRLKDTATAVPSPEDAATMEYSQGIKELMTPITIISTTYLSFLHRLHYSMVVDFKSSGLPWSGMKCRSLRAGGSSILCLLPILAEVHSMAKCWWVIQCFLALQADYFHVHHPSTWHGLDKIAAVITWIFMTSRVYISLDPMIYIPLVAVPSSFFLLASRAKDQVDLEAWKWCHLGWHVCGPFCSMIAICLMNH